YRDRGVEVRPGTLVSSVRRSGDEFLVSGKGEEGKPLRVDGVVAGLGIVPNVSLAESTGLEVDDGIVVDATFQTGDPRIWAAGDVASFYSPILDRRVRIEHEDHANSSGMLAGRGMAGEPSSYSHLPLFYSDLFDVSYEAVGVLDAEMETVEDWIEPHRKGVVHYLQNGLVRGVLLWNVPGKVKEARALIEEERRWMAPDLRGRIEVA
ncbi:MAG TPA: FAD-dependent oxidoreductase, partial [Longimicrobiales bacterium]|nr:FAD-dependent oxidoreductase [Longimicrobiales bacterium]